MENQKTAAERMRPILQAMERSIDTARRSRTKLPEPVAAMPVTPATTMIAPAITPLALSTEDDGTPRLKARAKRLPSPFLESPNRTDYRSQAG